FVPFSSACVVVLPINRVPVLELMDPEYVRLFVPRPAIVKLLLTMVTSPEFVPPPDKPPMTESKPFSVNRDPLVLSTLMTELVDVALAAPNCSVEPPEMVVLPE